MEPEGSLSFFFYISSHAVCSRGKRLALKLVENPVVAVAVVVSTISLCGICWVYVQALSVSVFTRRHDHIYGGVQFVS